MSELVGRWIATEKKSLQFNYPKDFRFSVENLMHLIKYFFYPPDCSHIFRPKIIPYIIIVLQYRILTD
jgi:hypothetical protein